MYFTGRRAAGFNVERIWSSEAPVSAATRVAIRSYP